MPKLHILPGNIVLEARVGSNLQEVLREAGIYLDAPCGGKGTCGKCKVTIGGEEVPACRTTICRDMTVILPETQPLQILQTGIEGSCAVNPINKGHLLAIDIGTTTVVCYLLDGITGKELARSSMPNPQAAFGADVISRIQAALRGGLEQETELIRHCLSSLIREVCGEAGISPDQIGVVSPVGNPAMQQLFLGISPENLAAVPFNPVLTEAKAVPCGDILPICPRAQLLVIPNISGYIGADTLGCVLAAELYQKEEITLLVDIGTNGEMVLGSKDRMIACAAAAGPALEGANIQFGMCAAEGAIDHVWLENGRLQCSVIGGGEAKGICGSGMIDAVAAALQTGLLNHRGRLRGEDAVLYLTQKVYLTQEDIRRIQLAKGAIHAGIVLMAKQLGIGTTDIRKVLLAGAFGNHLNPQSACRMGLLPEELADRIEAVGNAAGSGAKMLACDGKLLSLSRQLTEKIEFLELAGLPDFPKTFARAMRFREETP
ncbi:MAG: DUF4445 domain-containing protein [Oscillospiraceae bacterium]|nr:DUF4445 domain-containing protein [Oscillospiraceae bacterium]